MLNATGNLNKLWQLAMISDNERVQQLSTGSVRDGTKEVEMESPKKFKEKMVQVSATGAVSATALAKETGVAQSILSRWLLAECVIQQLDIIELNLDKEATTTLSMRPRGWR